MLFLFSFPCRCGVQNVTYRLLLYNDNSSSVSLVNLFSSALFIVSLYSMRRILLLQSCLFCYVCFTLEVGECIVLSDQFELSLCGYVLDCEETHDSWLWISLSLSLCVSLSTLSRTISHFGCTAARFCYLLIYRRRIIVSIVIDSFRGWSSWSCFRKSSFLWSLLDPPPAEDLIFSAFACFLVNLYVPTVRTRGIWLNRPGILLGYIIVLSLYREQTALVATRWTLGSNSRQWTIFLAMSCMPREERKHLYSARL
jgi:hypothetical protein